MEMKGHAKIELHNVKTGRDTVIEADNMVTNLWQSIINATRVNGPGFVVGGTKPSIPQNGFTTDYYGGIMCFQDTIEENPDNIFGQVGNIETAYANQSTTETSNPKYGILNPTLTEKLTNGFKFVWDWGLEKGNGQISCICLTSNKAGGNGCGDSFTRWTGTPYGNVKNQTRVGIDCTYESMCDRLDDNGFLWSVVTVDATHVQVRRYNTQATVAKPNHLLIYPQNGDAEYVVVADDIELPENNIMLKSTTDIRCQWFDMGSYLYGFANEGNQTGNAIVYWTKILKEDFSVTTGSFTLNETYLHAIATSKNVYQNNLCFYGVVAEGHLFICNYAMNGIYKIKLSDWTVTLISTGSITFQSNGDPNNDFSTSVQSYAGYVVPCVRYALKYIASKIYCGKYHIDPISEVVVTMPAVLYNDGRCMQHPFQFGNSPLYGSFGYQWYSSYTTDSWQTEGFFYFLAPQYLATINNLSEPVTKTADMTMRITYTITLSDVEE